MPEIKHTFQGARMNKDLDERLVPNGEYRDALNIQVRTSSAADSGSGIGDIGAVQNIRGPVTTGFSGHNYNNEPEFAVPIAMIGDDKNNCFYTFYAGVMPNNFTTFRYGHAGINDDDGHYNNMDDYPGRGLFLEILFIKMMSLQQP